MDARWILGTTVDKGANCSGVLFQGHDSLLEALYCSRKCSFLGLQFMYGISGFLNRSILFFEMRTALDVDSE
jgi:hypothetical protein